MSGHPSTPLVISFIFAVASLCSLEAPLWASIKLTRVKQYSGWLSTTSVNLGLTDGLASPASLHTQGHAHAYAWDRELSKARFEFRWWVCGCV